MCLHVYTRAHTHTRTCTQWIQPVTELLQDRGFRALVSMESRGVNDMGLLPRTPDSVGLRWGHELGLIKVFQMVLCGPILIPTIQLQSFIPSLDAQGIFCGQRRTQVWPHKPSRTSSSGFVHSGSLWVCAPSLPPSPCLHLRHGLRVHWSPVIAPSAMLKAAVIVFIRLTCPLSRRPLLFPLHLSQTRTQGHGIQQVLNNV